jgi:sec-independent protein translocase protein TatA
MFRSIGWQELVIVLVIVLILFGPKRLPQLGKTLGKTMRSIREGVEGKLGDGDDEAEVPGQSDTTASEEKSEDKTTL